MVSRFSAKKEIYFPTKILKPEGRSWCEHFPPPSLQKSVLKTVQWNVIIIIIYILYDYYYCCCCCRWWYLYSPQPPRVFRISFYWTTFHHYLGAWNRLSNHTFQVYYKVQQFFLLQSSTCITKCDRTHVPLALWARFLLSNLPLARPLTVRLFLWHRRQKFIIIGSKRQFWQSWLETTTL